MKLKMIDSSYIELGKTKRNYKFTINNNNNNNDNDNDNDLDDNNNNNNNSIIILIMEFAVAFPREVALHPLFPDRIRI